MANTYERLVAAGAPAIVEPEFYRIKPDAYNDGALVVEVRKRKPYRGSELLIRKTAYGQTDEDLLFHVVEACKQAVGELRLKDAMSELSGDYSSGVAAITSVHLH